jgi:hypothetical protein
MVAALMLVIVVGGLVIGGALLGSDDDPPPRRQAGITTTTASSKAEVESAYRAFLSMVARLDGTPNPDDPEIARRTTGTTRATFVKALARRRDEGQVIRLGPQDHRTIQSATVENDAAALAVCHVDHSGTFDAETGAV